jgi:hypothetical protein
MIEFADFAYRSIGEYGVHVVKIMVDGLPTLGIRILFDDDEQREEFIAQYLGASFEGVDEEIPEEAFA